MTAKPDRWVKRWDVPGSNGHTWVVAVDANGAYGCSCPRWKFHREECHHIAQVKAGGMPERGETRERPDYVLFHGCAPEVKEGKLLIPLVAFGDTDMEVTICEALLSHGYAWAEVRDLRHVPPQSTARAVLEHVARHGRAWRRCCEKWPHPDDAGSAEEPAHTTEETHP